MKKGDLVGVVWCDIQTDPTGDAEKAEPRVVRLPGFFQEYRTFEVDGKDITCLILTVSRDEEGDPAITQAPQEGWWCIPKACVISIKKLKKGR